MRMRHECVRGWVLSLAGTDGVIVDGDLPAVASRRDEDLGLTNRLDGAVEAAHQDCCQMRR